MVVPPDQDDVPAPPAPSRPALPPNPVPPAPASGRSPTNAPPNPPSSGQQIPRPDPQRTDVFQPGPDGKLHPIPGWHTTGPFDFGAWSHNIDWGGVANDLWTIGSGVADVLGVGELASGLIKAFGPGVESAVAAGLKEAIQRHHPLPKFMGGRPDQELADLAKSLHVKFHVDLGKALKAEGLPNVGGKSGSTVDWGQHFIDNLGSRERAIGILRRVTKDFDKAHGTSITPFLEKELDFVARNSANIGH